MSSSSQGGNSQPPPPPNKHPDSPSPPPPTTTTYPTYPPPHPAACYPPSGYPPVPGGHPYYHYPHNTTTYPYVYPPPATYHHVNDTATGRFFRSFIFCSCMILTVFFLMSLVMAMMLHPQLPIYKVVSMSVTNLTTTPALSGEWGTKVSIENPNEKLAAHFSGFRVDVMYKDGVIGVSYSPGFVLSVKEMKETEARGAATGNANLETATLEDMVKEKNATGSITFALRVSSVNGFKSGSFSSREAGVVAFCEGLRVVFPNNGGHGAFDSGGKPVECQLYV
ncbi:uncharacterized protein LOC130719253 [Lotus japonicus]|uniref:uncharacterized protein LOC130719253 n=1 Tax=Lotus japonicus TaxID=34305 RepID=UPI0025840D70|nr:uncharacterized protein LOC130719253 [Lotus japonicus]